MKEDINETLERISLKMHKRTGYSVIHAVLECEDEMDLPRFFKFNSDEWEIFLLILEEACN